MRTYLSTIICICICISACQSPKHSIANIKTISLDARTTSNETDISSLFEDSVEITKLETTETCLFRADAPKIITDKYIWINDHISKQIFMFDRQGKFLRTIGHIGRGPGEYVDLAGFCYRKDSIYIHDRVQAKLIGYSVADNGFQERQILPPIYSSGIMTAGDCLYFITNYSNDYNLISLNLTTNHKTYRLPYPPEISKRESRWDLNRYDANYRDSILFILSRNDTIYQLLNDTLSPKYIVDFPTNKLPEHLLKEKGSEILQTALSKGYICGLDRIFQTDAYIIGNFGEGSKNHQFIYNKINGQTTLTESFILQNLGSLPILNPITTDNNELICFYDALLLKEFGSYILKNHPFARNSDKEKLAVLLSSLKEDDNPVMLTLKFKTIR